MICVSQVREHKVKSLGIFVSHVGEHISHGMCVSLVGEQISLVIFVSLAIFVSRVAEHINRDMCFPGRKTHLLCQRSFRICKRTLMLDYFSVSRPGYAMLMNPHKDETAVHGCHNGCAHA